MNNTENFVIVGLQPWYTTIGSNCKHIARQLAKKHRVLYINAPLDRRTIMVNNHDEDVAQHIKIIKNNLSPLTEVEPNLWVYYPKNVLESINWIPLLWLFKRINHTNNVRFAKDILNAAQRLNFTDFILFNDNEIFRAIYLKKLLKPKLYIYYCRDYLLGVDYWKKHGQKLESEHVKIADLALANSFYLTQYLAKYNQNAIDIGQGCDVDQFNGKKSYPIPADITEIKKPRIGYVGMLNHIRLDINCLVHIAKARPQWQLILVGPEDQAFKDSELHQLANVHFIGKKNMDELPAYIASFDVCLNPQLINEVTIGNYPLKIDEYLNMGKPVVATRTKTMDIFEGYTYLTNKPEDYIPLIEEALMENSPLLEEKRMAFAREHTWENCVDKMYLAISQTLTKH